MTAKYEHDDIAEIAYRAWLDRGQPDGSPEIDWYYALSVVSNPEEIRMTPSGRSLSEESADDTERTVFNGGVEMRDAQQEQQKDIERAVPRSRSGRKSSLDGKERRA